MQGEGAERQQRWARSPLWLTLPGQPSCSCEKRTNEKSEGLKRRLLVLAKDQMARARTAGVMFACLSLGMVVCMRECFGSESLSQRYLFITELKRLYLGLRIIVHDDACLLHK